MEKYVFSTNSEIDEELAKGPIPDDEIKFYPGSINGPEPEDDPAAYSKWFVDNQPKCMLDEHGQINSRDIGAKEKYLKMVQDSSDNNEIKQPITHFFDNNDAFPMVDYTG